VIDVYKTSYATREAANDRVQLQKGRRLLSQKTSDTLAVKVVGGPSLSIYLDVVKNQNALLSTGDLDFYDFYFEAGEFR